MVTELASPAFTVGSSHEIRAMVQGDRLRVWVDFVQYIDVDDSALTTGTKHGPPDAQRGGDGVSRGVKK